MPNSSKQFRLNFRSPLFLIPLAMLVAGELILRVPAVRDLLPPPRPYYDVGIETRLAKLETLQKTDTVDVLFVGSSIVRTNVQPTVFDSVLAAAGNTGVVSFNGGFSGMHPDPARLYLEHFWLPRTRPRVVLQSVGFGELSSERRAEEWEDFKVSRLERLWISETGMSRVSIALIARLKLLYYQGSMASWFAEGWSGAKGRDFPIDDRGFGPTEMTLPEAMAAGKSRGPGAYGDPYEKANFAVGIEALRNEILISRRHGVAFMIVNMPEHCGRYLKAPDGQERYRAFLSVLHELAVEEQVPLIDITGGDPARWCDDNLFSDDHHMSPAGARKFSIELARAIAELPDPWVLAQGRTRSPTR
jgi:hypothetical protein